MFINIHDYSTLSFLLFQNLNFHSSQPKGLLKLTIGAPIKNQQPVYLQTVQIRWSYSVKSLSCNQARTSSNWRVCASQNGIREDHSDNSFRTKGGPGTPDLRPSPNDVFVCRLPDLYFVLILIDLSVCRRFSFVCFWHVLFCLLSLIYCEVVCLLYSLNNEWLTLSWNVP